MAKPRVFISSTYYDLKHLRSSLENFIESRGFEPVLSEKGDIAYSHDTPLDEDCYREAAYADLFVLIVGGRYGTHASDQMEKNNFHFFEQYDSITKREYQHALSRNVPTYILIDSNVYAEYRTYSKNKDRNDIIYAHVDNISVFRLIEDILSQRKGNPVFPFERYAEIEDWLKEQWAGFFKELLEKRSQQAQIVSLSEKVAELGEINITLKTYMERIMSKMSPEAYEEIITSETKRLEDARLLNVMQQNSWVGFVSAQTGVSLENCIQALKTSHKFEDFAKNLNDLSPAACKVENLEILRQVLAMDRNARRDFNDARTILGLPHILD